MPEPEGQILAPRADAPAAPGGPPAAEPTPPRIRRKRPPAPLLVRYLLVTVAGTALGLAAAALALNRGLGFGGVTAGPWTAWPKAGGGADPYMRAMLAHSGEIPLGASEGLSFVARTDSAGRPLDPTCDYAVSGQTPQARYWTLSVSSPDGLLFANPSERSGFTSTELLRDASGAFLITLSRRARPGNWLPLAEHDPFILSLRLYESEFSAATLAFEATNLPRIERGACV